MWIYVRLQRSAPLRELVAEAEEVAARDRPSAATRWDEALPPLFDEAAAEFVDAYLERLRKTGRAHHAERLAKLHPDEV